MALIEAVRQSADDVRQLLENGADINETDFDGRNALFYANDPLIVEILLKNGINVNAVERNGKNALFYARNPASVQLLLQAGIDRNKTEFFYGNNSLYYTTNPAIAELLMDTVNHRNRNNMNALFGPAGSVPEIVRSLIYNKINVEILSRGLEETALFHQIESDPAVYRMLLKTRLRTMVNYRNDQGGQTALDYQIHPQIVNYLLEADPTGENGHNYLFGQKNPDIVRLYLNTSRRTRINASWDARGENPLFFCNGMPAETVRLLLEAGSSATKINGNGESVLFKCNSSDTDPEVIRLLLEAGAPVNQINRDGRNALFFHYNSSPEIIRLLLEAGCSPQQIDERGENPLFIQERLENIQLMVSFGAQLDVVNSYGQNLLFTQTTDENIIRYLLDNGLQTDVNRIDGSGWNALFYQGTNPMIVRYLLDAGIDVNVTGGSFVYEVEYPLKTENLPCDEEKSTFEESEQLKSLYIRIAEIVEMLVLRGSNIPLAVNYDKYRGIYSKQENLEVVMILLKSTANRNLNVRDELGRNALHYNNSPEGVKMLLDAFLWGYVNELDEEGRNALFSQESPEVVRVLLRHGCKIKQLDLYGRNALFARRRNGAAALSVLLGSLSPNSLDPLRKTPIFTQVDPAAVEVLLERGANVNHLNRDYQNALFFQRNAACARVLVNNGCVIGHRDVYNLNALYYLKNEEVLRYLIEEGIDFSNFFVPIVNLKMEAYRGFFNFLLDSGFNINNFKYLHKDNYPWLFRGSKHRDPAYGYRDLFAFLQENGHQTYLDEMSVKNGSIEEIINRSDLLALAKMVDRHPERVNVSTVLASRRIRMIYQLYHAGLLKDKSIDIVPLGPMRLNTLERVQLFVRLLDNYENDQLILREVQNLSNHWQEVLNKIVAPMFIQGLYLSPINQKRLYFKEDAFDDEGYRFLRENTLENEEETYLYLRDNAKALFEYLSVEEILTLLDVSFDQLYQIRLRRNHRDLRTMEEILKQDYRGKFLENLLFEKYGEDFLLENGRSHRLLWRLLFE